MNEKLTLRFSGRQIRIEISAAAVRALQQREKPLMVEMELYFSCLIRKRVRFYDTGEHGHYAIATQKLRVGFRPVMTAHCSVHDIDGPPPLTDFTIRRPESFIPRWLHIDHRHGQWTGDFGYLDP